jgi:molybdopterin-containing oxidoreductase family membrane subunit
MEMFPGQEVLESGFFDGAATEYIATMPEILLGLGGIAVAMIIVALGVKVLGFLPQTLDDSVTDPHYKAE